MNSRYLVYEAQQAHYYGLPHNLALAAVTTTPATVMGQDHRIGYVKEGYDAGAQSLHFPRKFLTLACQMSCSGIATLSQSAPLRSRSG